MTEPHVLEHVPCVPADKKVLCPLCGKEFWLFFNGGELDGRWCCGRMYRLEHCGIALVVYDDQTRDMDRRKRQNL